MYWKICNINVTKLYQWHFKIFLLKNCFFVDLVDWKLKLNIDSFCFLQGGDFGIGLLTVIYSMNTFFFLNDAKEKGVSIYSFILSFFLSDGTCQI